MFEVRHDPKIRHVGRRGCRQSRSRNWQGKLTDSSLVREAQESISGGRSNWRLRHSWKSWRGTCFHLPVADVQTAESGVRGGAEGKQPCGTVWRHKYAVSEVVDCTASHLTGRELGK